MEDKTTEKGDVKYPLEEFKGHCMGNGLPFDKILTEVCDLKEKLEKKRKLNNDSENSDND